jgi:L-lactate dehydrogenase complex protein LldF
MNPYTSIWTGVTPGDGPAEFHLVLLDNGRTATLADPVGRSALRCIRCSACLNVCPVYERTGGAAYGSVYPGPIGAILTPQLVDDPHDKQAASLPYASSLCGACYEVCPVRIDIPSVLVHLRAQIVEAKGKRTPEAAGMAALGWILGSPKRYEAAQKAGSLARLLAKSGQISRLPWPGSKWTVSRDLPAPPKESFRAWWRRTHG